MCVIIFKKISIFANQNLFSQLPLSCPMGLLLCLMLSHDSHNQLGQTQQFLYWSIWCTHYIWLARVIITENSNLCMLVSCLLYTESFLISCTWPSTQTSFVGLQQTPSQQAARGDFLYTLPLQQISVAGLNNPVKLPGQSVDVTQNVL